MISAVLDTNVLASGTVSSSTPPGQILNAWRNGQFELVLSTHIIDELEHTFQKIYFQNHLTKQEITNFFDLLQNEATIVSVTAKVQGVSTHAEDDLTLATVLSAKAGYFITGDGPLLRKVGPIYKGVAFLSPGDFVKILQGKK